MIDNSLFVHFYYYFECSVGKYTMNATENNCNYRHMVARMTFIRLKTTYH